MPTNADPLYLDSSALVKLVIRETESDALARFLAGFPVRVSSELALVEVVRAVRPQGMSAVSRARDVLRRVHLMRLDAGLLEDAALLDPVLLRTLDALHLESARAASIADVVTYDHRMAEAARVLGFRVEMPRSA